MKRMSILITLLVLLLGIMLAALAHPAAVKALPEYSAQTGEPCATCHLSPSGGGPRGPRGQAWVGGGKPGAVPSLADSLEILGIELEVDPQDYMAGSLPVQPPQPLQLEAEQGRHLHGWLKDYNGN